MTSLPISSKTKTFHVAESVDGSLIGSSCASTLVTGALRFRMRLMLARGLHQPNFCEPSAARLPICLSRSVTAMAWVAWVVENVSVWHPPCARRLLCPRRRVDTVACLWVRRRCAVLSLLLSARSVVVAALTSSPPGPSAAGPLAARQL